MTGAHVSEKIEQHDGDITPWLLRNLWVWAKKESLDVPANPKQSKIRVKFI